MKERGGVGGWGGRLVAAALVFSGTASGADLSVAAAADLKFALEAAIPEFKKSRPDVEVKTTFGSSGSFFAQISNGAPFDLFLSADADYPAKLLETGLAVAGSEFVYGAGRLVLWVRKESPLDVEGKGLAVLEDPRAKQIAIANPRHAPYGRAAEAALKSLGLFDAVTKKLVFGENVAQAAQFVESGAADAGLVALSLALAPGMAAKGRWVEVPVSSYPAMRQTGVLLKRSMGSSSAPSASAFREFLIGPEGRAVLARYGFVPPSP